MNKAREKERHKLQKVKMNKKNKIKGKGRSFYVPNRVNIAMNREYDG